MAEMSDSDDIQARFQAAVAASKSLADAPDTGTLLELYALYKQATVGDAEGERPGGMVANAKYDAWRKLRGTSRDEAMDAYIALVDSLG
jgi:diazepam-binding inhibitor (GABA receptor modulator, acyl-CoA-binding protein)